MASSCQKTRSSPGCKSGLAPREGQPAAAYLRVPLTAQDLESCGELGLASSAGAYAAWCERTAARLRQSDQVELPEVRSHPPAILLFGSPEEPHLVRIRADGTLARLKVVVANLLGRFDSWFEEEAVAFVLAGVVPPLDKLRAQARGGLYRAASRIHLDCDPRTAPARSRPSMNSCGSASSKAGTGAWKTRAWPWPSLPRSSGDPAAAGQSCRSSGTLPTRPGDPLHSEVSLNQFRTECRLSWERLSGELWPGGKRAKRKLQDDIAAARKYAQGRLSQRPRRRLRPS